MKSWFKKHGILIILAIVIIIYILKLGIVDKNEPVEEQTVSEYVEQESGTFTINYNTKLGFIPDDAPMSYKEEDGEIILPIPIKTGHTFLGWYVSERCEGEPVTIIEADSTGNRTFYAAWRVNLLTINYYTNISEKQNELVYTETYRYVNPPTYSLTDYTGSHQKIFIDNPNGTATGFWGTEPDGGILIAQDEPFIGWELGDKLGIAEDFAESDQEINLYAQWKEN